MKTIEEKLSNGNVLQYHQLDNGTCYNVKTPVGVVEVLEMARTTPGFRIRVFYGDQETGRCWGDEYDTVGFVGRSSGKIKIPLLIKTRRSFGGGAILDSAVVKITASRSTLYEHPRFTLPAMKVVESHVPGYTHGVDFDHVRQANFVTKEKAERYVAFMKGERNCK